MRLLLDTHAFLWWTANSPEVSSRARELLEDPEAEVFVSAVVPWEVAIKAGLGRLTVPDDLPSYFSRMIERHAFSRLPVTFEHALAVRDLPAIHRDPFDRLLVAQARVEGLTLVSSDPVLARYGVAVAW